MSYDDDLEAGAEILNEAFGQSVTYTPYGGSGTTLSAVVDGERVELTEENDRKVKRRLRDVVVSRDDLASPSLRSTVTVDSLAYAVRDILYLPGNQLQLVLVRTEPMDKTRNEPAGRS